ncbi:MAG: GNAT family N-acetyltransferase [Flavobacterium sp.]|uniref:GNAT family N-acetyltransferase n=1 Tax=Flavobacterium sp. TaxID=239 RepID=UPI003264EFC8
MTNRIFTPFPILNTDRLILRQLVNTDDNEIFALRSDDNVNRYLGRQPSKSIEDAKSFIQAITENVKKNDSIYWAISLSGNLIGTICLFEFSDDNTKAEIGYELLPSYQGKGFMQEAVLEVLEFGFQHIGLNSIEAYTHSENQNSTKLLEKFNFKKQLSSESNSDKSFIVFKLLK